MDTSGNRDCQRASRSALKDLTDDALTISAGSLFENGTGHHGFAGVSGRIDEVV